MLKGIRIIIAPFLITTLFCIGGVELFYAFIDHALFQETAGYRKITSSVILSGESVKNNIPSQNYKIILDRNLFGAFSDSSGQAAKKKDPLEGLKPTSLNVVLMGTVIGSDAEKSAVILEKGKRKQELYHVGDSIKGAIVKDILRGKVILDVHDRDEILDMSEAQKYGAGFVGPSPPNGQGRIVNRPGTGVRQQSTPALDMKIAPPIRRSPSRVGSSVPRE